MGDFVCADGGIAGGRTGGFGVFDLRISWLSGSDQELSAGCGGDDEGDSAPFGQDVGSGELKGCLLLTASRRDSSAPLTFGNAEEIDFDGRHSDIDCRAGDRLLHHVGLKVLAVRIADGDDTGECVHFFCEWN